MPEGFNGMDTIKKHSTSQQENKSHSFGKEKNIYDIINSEGLELLYKKNAHLLARLSKTGRENTRLYTTLSTLAKEKSLLGNSNTVLKSKCLNLKEQISLFARQHREFNHQSHRLKRELEEIKKLQVQDGSKSFADPELLKKQEKEIKLLEKKEQVYVNQIKNLQNLRKAKKEENQFSLKSLQEKHDKTTQALEGKLKNLSQLLEMEKNKAAQNQSSLKNLQKKYDKNSQILREKIKKTFQLLDTEKNKMVQNYSSQLKHIQETNINLNKKLKIVEKELKDKNKNYQLVLKEKKGVIVERDQLSNTLQENLQELSLKTKNLREFERENQKLKKKGNNLNQWAEKLKKEEQLILKENQKIKIQKEEVQEAKKIQGELLNYKNQVSEFIRQKEQLQSEFAEQINLFNKERDSLKFQCESFKKVLSTGKLGFDQAMLSFQRKYIKLYQSWKELQEQTEEKTKLVQMLKDKAEQSKKQLSQEKEESEAQIRQQKDKHIRELCEELKASKKYNKDLENQLQTLKTTSKDLFLKEKNQMQKKIQDLMWNKDKNFLHFEEKHKTEVESLKSDHERQISNLESGFKKKLQHIRIEMENDLCSEKKRYEIFKNMKMKQMGELKDSLSVLQTQNHELKTKKFVLEKSLGKTKESLDKYLKNNKKWENQSQILNTLWQDLHKQNEAKDIQIRSLQKLNRSLSLSLNQNKKQEISSSAGATVVSDQKLSIEEKLKKDEQSINRVLADIHFD